DPGGDVGARDPYGTGERQLAHVVIVRAGERPRQPRHDRLRRDVALPHRYVQRLEVGELHLLGEEPERLLGGEALEGDVLLAHQPLERIAALLKRILPPLPAEPLTDLVAGPGSLHEPQPILGWSLTVRLRGDDLDRIPGAQLVVQRHELPADLGADRA